nr:xylulose kinase-1 [Tanacetum cinerariifolium]
MEFSKILSSHPMTIPTLLMLFKSHSLSNKTPRGSHYGYNCPPKVPVIPDPKPFNNQTVDELPQTVLSFDPTCYSKDGNSFTYDSTSNLVHESLNIFNPPLQPLIYSYEFCGNDAYYGHNCSLQVPFTYDSEPCYNQDFNFPQNFQIFQQYPCCPHETCQCDQLIFDEPYCENCEGPHMNFQCQPMNQNHYEPNLCYDSNSFGFKQFQPLQFPVIYQPIREKTYAELLAKEHEANINTQPFQYSVVPQPPQEEMSFILAWETILEIELAFEDKHCQPEDILELFQRLHNDVQNIHEELAVYINTPNWDRPTICYSDDDDEDYIIAVTPSLSTKEPDNSLSMGDEHLDTIPAMKLDEFIKSSVESLVPIPKISSGNTTTHSNCSLYDLFISDLSINPFPPANRSDFYEFIDELTHNISPPEYDCFCFKNEPNSGDFTMDVVEDIFPTREPRVHMHNVLPTHPTFQLNLDFILSSESLFAYVPGHLAARLGYAETKVATWDDLAFKLINIGWKVKHEIFCKNVDPRYVVPTGGVIVPAGRYIVPTSRVIVLTGRYVVPAGSDNDSDHASIHNEAPNNHQQPNIQPQIITTVSNNNAKFPYLKKDEYERESKVRTTLLQSIPDDHIADFHYMDDARDIWNAVKARFSGNAESKKMRKSMLKQEFSYFRISEAEGLHKGATSTNEKMSYGDSLTHSSTTTYSVPSNSKTRSYRTDLEQIEKLDLEEIELKWKMAMLSVQQAEGQMLQVSTKRPFCQGMQTNHDSESDGVIAAKEFGMIAVCDSGDALKEGTAKLYNLIIGANSEEANTAGDAGEFALMGVTSELTLEDKIRVLSIELENTSNLLKYSERINADVETAKKDLQTQLDNHVARIKSRPIFHRFANTDSMKAVPPPLTGDYTSLSDHADLDESQMSYVTSLQRSTQITFPPVILVSNLHSTSQMILPHVHQLQVTHLIKDCDFYEKQMANKTVDIGAGPAVTLVPPGKLHVSTPVPTGRPNRPFPVPTDRGYSPSVLSELASPEQTATCKDISNPFMAVMICQKSLGYSNSPMIHVLRVGLVINPPGYVVPTGRVIVPTGRYIVPTGRVIVPTGRYVVPAEEVVPKVDDVSLVDGAFDVAFGGDGDVDFVIGEMVVSSSSLVKSTNIFLGGMMVCMIFFEGLEEEAWVKAIEVEKIKKMMVRMMKSMECLHARSLRNFHHHHHHRWDERRMVDRRRMKKKWMNDLFSCHNPFDSFTLVERNKSKPTRDPPKDLEAIFLLAWTTAVLSRN